MQGYMSRHFEEICIAQKKKICQIAIVQEKLQDISHDNARLDNSVQFVGHKSDEVASNVQLLLHQKALRMAGHRRQHLLAHKLCIWKYYGYQPFLSTWTSQ